MAPPGKIRSWGRSCSAASSEFRADSREGIRFRRSGIPTKGPGVPILVARLARNPCPGCNLPDRARAAQTDLRAGRVGGFDRVAPVTGSIAAEAPAGGCGGPDLARDRFSLCVNPTDRQGRCSSRCGHLVRSRPRVHSRAILANAIAQALSMDERIPPGTELAAWLASFAACRGLRIANDRLRVRGDRWKTSSSRPGRSTTALTCTC